MRAYGQTNAAPYASAPAVGASGDTYWNTTEQVLYVSNGTAWVKVGPPRARARVVQAGALPGIPNNVNTALTFDTESTDVGGFFNPAQPDRFTIPEDGFYIFGAAAAFSTSNTGTRRVLSVTVGGVSITGNEAPQGNERILSATAGVALLTGAVLQVFMYQDSGFGLGLGTGVAPNFWIVRSG
jgi:hypothetical protein